MINLELSYLDWYLLLYIPIIVFAIIDLIAQRHIYRIYQLENRLSKKNIPIKHIPNSFLFSYDLRHRYNRGDWKILVVRSKIDMDVVVSNLILVLLLPVITSFAISYHLGDAFKRWSRVKKIKNTKYVKISNILLIGLIFSPDRVYELEKCLININNILQKKQERYLVRRWLIPEMINKHFRKELV